MRMANLSKQSRGINALAIKYKNILNISIFILFIAAVYTPYIAFGTFNYDDWSVSQLGLSSATVVEATSKYFINFANRPLAALYYGLISRFEDRAYLYILLNIGMWEISILIIGNVIKSQIGVVGGVFFIYLASIPLVSSTIIFSPGMQSLGSFALLNWALSLYVLKVGVIAKSYSYVFISAFFIFLMTISYEVFFPLLWVSILYPCFKAHSFRLIKRDRNIFILNAVCIVLIVIAAYLYQTKIIPKIFNDLGGISRFRSVNIETLPLIIKFTLRIVFYEYPALLWKGIFHSPVDLISIRFIVPLLIAVLGITWMTELFKFNERAMGGGGVVWWISLLLAIFGVALIHWAASVGPTAFGYANRGLGSLAIILPLMISSVITYFLKYGKFLKIIGISTGIVVFAISSACFFHVSSNFIEISRLHKVIMRDIDYQFKRYESVRAPRILLADVPQFLQEDFNGETVYSDEVHDFAMSLNQDYPGQYSRSGTLTTKKVCSKIPRVYINRDVLKIIGPDNDIPIEQIWFYRFSIRDKESMLIKVSDPQSMNEIITKWFVCSDSAWVNR